MNDNAQTERETSAYNNQPIMGEEYVNTRDRRESKKGRMLFYAFLACIVIGIILVIAFGITDKFRLEA